jgi:hypothetical protein
MTINRPQGTGVYARVDIGRTRDGLAQSSIIEKNPGESDVAFKQRVEATVAEAADKYAGGHHGRA